MPAHVNTTTQLPHLACPGAAQLGGAKLEALEGGPGAGLQLARSTAILGHITIQAQACSRRYTDPCTHTNSSRYADSSAELAPGVTPLLQDAAHE